MRINQFGVDTAVQANGNKARPNTEASFDEVLARQLGNARSGQPSATASQEVSGTAPVTQKSAPDLVNRVDGLLNTMEEYAGMLENGDVSLKAMTPVVERMDQESKMVANMLDDNDDDHVTLLAREAVARAQVETIRFNRGDYI